MAKLPQNLPSDLKQFGKTLGFDQIGITSAAPPHDYSRYLDWVAKGHAANMWYLTEAERKKKRGDIQRILPGARSVIVGAISYAPHHPTHPSSAKFGRYAWGKDYHGIVAEKMGALETWLKKHVEEAFASLVYVDTGPILERSLAERAGVGWIGKNTCLIHENSGSYLYLGELLTTLDLGEDLSAVNRCGTCTRCLDACPTDALVGPYQLDANRCISYHTIENRTGDLPPEIASSLDGWVAGCDICQEVCPWNSDIPPVRLSALQPGPHIKLTLPKAESLSEEEFQAYFAATSFKRIGWRALARNARAAQRSLRKTTQ